jgi:integrase
MSNTTTATTLRVIPCQASPRPVPYYAALVAERMRQTVEMGIVDYVEVYATTHELEPETVRQYRVTAERIEVWAGQRVLLTDLNELMVSAFLRDYAAAGVKPATVRSKRTQLMALWRSAADEYLCDPPTRRVRSARVPWEPRECWTLEEVRQLLQAASWLPRTFRAGMPRAEWFDLAIRIAWDSGLRWGDQMRLRVDQIHGDIAVVSQSKTRRPVCGKLSASTMARLAESLRRHPRELVTPWSSSHETFNAQVRRLVVKAGVRPGTWKWLRRGSATDVEIQQPGRGMAARHLGHAPGSRIAELHYLDPRLIAEHVPIVSPRDLEPEGGAVAS